MKVWLYLNGQQQGPFNVEDIVDIPGLTEETLAWYEGLPKWYPAGTLPELKYLFDKETLGQPASGGQTTTSDDAEVGQVIENTENAVVTDLAEVTETTGETEAAQCAGTDGHAERHTAPEENVAEAGDTLAEEPSAETGDGVYYNPAAAAVAPRPRPACPPSYIGWSVFLIVCCCSPFSLAALIASVCVSSFYARGDMARARKASEWAAWLIMVTIALGIIPVALMSALMN